MTCYPAALPRHAVRSAARPAPPEGQKTEKPRPAPVRFPDWASI